MHEIRTGVIAGVAHETVCSEANVCIIVQNEVALNLALLADDHERMESVEQAAAQAILGVFGSDVPFHAYSVLEATRGVMHGLVCAGLDISYVTRLALRGIRQALVQVDVWSPETESAMKEGLKSALTDLGMTSLEQDQALDLPDYYMRQTLLFGRSQY